MNQKIVISGIKNKHGTEKYGATRYDDAFAEVVGCLNREPQAVFEYVGQAMDAGNVNVTRAYDRNADTITITRVWNDAGWAGYQEHATNAAAVKAAFEAAGYTVTITETA